MKIIWAEIGESGLTSRIIKTHKEAVLSPLWPEGIRKVDYFRARSEIKQQVHTRQQGECNRCSLYLSIPAMHLHEIVPRGEGGIESLDNCEGLCADCHIWGKNSAHGNRRPKFSKGS